MTGVAEILRVGTFENGYPVDWSFDCKGCIPAIEILVGGRILFAGYSVEELHAISTGANWPKVTI